MMIMLATYYKRKANLPDLICTGFMDPDNLGEVVNIPSQVAHTESMLIHLNEMSVPVCYWELQQSEGILKPVRQIRFYMVQHHYLFMQQACYH